MQLTIHDVIALAELEEINRNFCFPTDLDKLSEWRERHPLINKQLLQ